jgi:hypothetical protein
MSTWRDIHGWCDFEWLYESQVELVTDGAWFVVFRDGSVSGNFKYSRGQVRAVRDGL